MEEKRNKQGAIFIVISFLICTGFCLPASSAAVGNKPLELLQQRSYSIKDGLPQNTIYSITQTKDGFIWVGTNAGLARFDGIDFDVYNSENTERLTDDIIYWVMPDDDGTLWIGTDKSGLMHFRNERIEDCYSRQNGLLSNEVRIAKKFRDGSVWVGTPGGLNRIDNGIISVYPFPDPGTYRWMESLAEDSNGIIWCGTSNGLLKLKKINTDYQWIETGLANQQISVITRDQENRMWVGTNGNGIYGYWKDNTFIRYSHQNGLSSNLIGVIFFDNSGIPWIGTRSDGINVIKDNSISVLNHKNGLSHDYISSIFEDKEGNVWIGTNGGGLNILYDSKVTSYNTQNGLSYDHVFGVYQDSKNVIWVGTFGGGINCIKNRKIIKQLTVNDGLPSNFIITIVEDHSGNMWFGTYGNGIVRMERTTGKMTVFSTRNGLISDYIYGLYIDRKGHLWAGTNKGGLHRFTGDSFKLVRTLEGKMRAFLEDSKGNLWVGSDGFGLLRIQVNGSTEEKDWKTEIFDKSNGLSSQDILCIFEDKKGIIWVGTYGGGVNRYSYQDGMFSPVRHSDGLISDVIFWILEDCYEQLWMSSMKGIFQVSRKELEQFFSTKNQECKKIQGIIYDESSGMKVRECNGGSQPSGWYTGDGQLLFITTVGLASVDTFSPLEKVPSPPVSIKRVIIDGVDYTPAILAEVPSGKGNIEIHYTGLSYRSPESVHFKYKLEGFDDDWIDSGTRRQAYYTNISHGDYCFRVIAGNVEGIWNETGTAFSFRIKPNIAETWVFKFLVLLFVLLLIRLFAYLKMKRIHTRQKELEHLVEERTQTLKSKTQELEKINSIVKSINSEVNPKDILISILKESAFLEGIERAAALVYDKSHKAFLFKATVGYSDNQQEGNYLNYDEIKKRFIDNSTETIENIYIVNDIDKRTGEDIKISVEIPKSMLILEIGCEDSSEIPAGYLIFEDINDENSFEKRDIKLLKNVKDHIASAFIKSKLLLELKSEQVAAEAANHAKSMFLARMSHEIRTPMNSVIGFADMLMDTPLNEEQKEYSQNITKCGESLLHLIDEILDFSKVEAGEWNFQPLDFDLEVMAFDICKSIQPRIAGKPVEILCRIGDNIPAYVYSDPARIRQVLVNLMGNAAKFTNEGELELALEITEETQEQLKLHATVRDTGIGISPEQVSLIFEVFQQADGSITRRYGGTGLGLAISKQIAAFLKGSIWVESQPGNGSTFHFVAWVDKSTKVSTKVMSLEALEDKKVLLVDDNLNNLDILLHIVKGAGMKADKVSESLKVVPLLEDALTQNAPFDLCVLDIQLPGFSGCDVAQQIRSHPNPAIAKLPLLGFSATVAKLSKFYRKCGFDGFLPRPIQKKTLLDMMKRLLSMELDSPGNRESQQCDEEKMVTQHSLVEEAKHAVKILLAEDNLLNQKLARFMLTKGGYQLEVVNNGKEALDVFTANPEQFHLIFMDVNMPEMDGREATRLIREKGFTDIPIIALTAHALKEDRQQCIDAGMNDYISKPIKRDVVFSIINKYVIKQL